MCSQDASISRHDFGVAHWDQEQARDRLGRSGSPAESPFEFAKSACERHAAGGTPALRFMESGITVGNGAPNSYARPLAKTT